MGTIRRAVRDVIRERQLRRTLRRELAALEIEEPASMTEVCRRLSGRRAKPIRLVAFPLEVPGPFGVWVATDTADYIFYQAETTSEHQAHIIAHELGHLLANHHSHGAEDEVWQELFPDVPADQVRRALGTMSREQVRSALRRGAYDTAEEREAETVATVLLGSASVAESLIRPVSSERASRVQRALGDRRRWL